jgi:spore germination protein GerM
MNRFTVALLAVSLLVMSGCNGRRILHGSGKHYTKRAATTSCATAGPGLNVWFVKSKASGLDMVSVVRKVSRQDRLQQSVQELLEGPDADEERAGLGTEIPRGTILLGMSRKGNDIEINLSRRFASGGGSTSFLARLEQLRKTVSVPAGANDVYLSVEGKRLNVEEGEGIEIHQPINR